MNRVAGRMLSIGSTVLGVNDLARATAFWHAALGYFPQEPGDETWVILVPGSGPGAQLALMLSETPVQEHPRIWDLYPEDPDFVVLADPDGNRFCVIDKSPR